MSIVKIYFNIIWNSFQQATKFDTLETLVMIYLDERGLSNKKNSQQGFKL